MMVEHQELNCSRNKRRINSVPGRSKVSDISGPTKGFDEPEESEEKAG